MSFYQKKKKKETDDVTEISSSPFLSLYRLIMKDTSTVSSGPGLNQRQVFTWTRTTSETELDQTKSVGRP